MANERDVILFSGSGSTAEYIVKAQKIEHRLEGIEVVGAIASRPDAKGIPKLLDLNVEVRLCDPRDYKDDDGYADALIKTFDELNGTVYTQNGHLPGTPGKFIRYVKSRGQGGFNQHPGSLPDFGGIEMYEDKRVGMYGKRVHLATLLAKRQFPDVGMWTEVVAHRVEENVDEGRVVWSKQVPIKRFDTVDDLQGRTLPEEHEGQVVLLNQIGARTVVEEPVRQTLFQPDQLEMLKIIRLHAALAYPQG